MSMATVKANCAMITSTAKRVAALFEDKLLLAKSLNAGSIRIAFEQDACKQVIVLLRSLSITNDDLIQCVFALQAEIAAKDELIVVLRQIAGVKPPERAPALP